jgi:glutathione S-transferase
MRRLDQLVPDPPLFPADASARAKVEEAERWGDEVFQPVARELIWAGFTHQPDAMASYGEHSRLPMPAPAIRLSAPLIDDRPCAALARALFPDADGELPAGSLPAA